MSDIDYGPIAALVGTWKGNKGLDVAPDPDEADGIERNPYSETIEFVAVGDVTNANKQTLSVVRYHQVVSRKSNNEVFHDQIGYWTYDPATGTVTHSLTIPRGFALVAGGQAQVSGDTTSFKLSANINNDDFCISQTDFMFKNAKTTAFTIELDVTADSMSYRQSTMLDIYGGEFDHRDKSELTRVS